MKRFMTASALGLAALGTAATAGSLAEPVVEAPSAPVEMAPVPVNYGGDWTGPYVGLSFGQLWVDDGTNDDGTHVYGLFGGYDYDFGRFVAGAELDWQSADDLSVSGVDVNNITRLKLRGGYDAGPALIYATAGVARADSSIGDADGGVYGLGMDYKVTNNFAVGVEYLRHDFNDFADSGVDVEADTLSLRGSFRF